MERRNDSCLLRFPRVRSINYNAYNLCVNLHSELERWIVVTVQLAALHDGKNGAMVLLFSFLILILLEMNLSQIFTFRLPL